VKMYRVNFRAVLEIDAENIAQARAHARKLRVIPSSVVGAGRAGKHDRDLITYAIRTIALYRGVKAQEEGKK
jgi:hypothetical protein